MIKKQIKKLEQVEDISNNRQFELKNIIDLQNNIYEKNCQRRRNLASRKNKIIKKFQINYLLVNHNKFTHLE